MAPRRYEDKSCQPPWINGHRSRISSQLRLSRSPASRSAFLRERCKDAEICSEVERLLREHEEAGTFLSTPFLEA